MHESNEGANVLIDALFRSEICALLVQNLDRLDESVKEESDGVHKTLCGSELLISSMIAFQLININLVSTSLFVFLVLLF